MGGAAPVFTTGRPFTNIFKQSNFPFFKFGKNVGAFEEPALCAAIGKGGAALCYCILLLENEKTPMTSVTFVASQPKALSHWKIVAGIFYKGVFDLY